VVGIQKGEKMRHDPVTFVRILLLVAVFGVSTALAAGQGRLDAAIEEPFRQILAAHPELARTGGARMVETGQNTLALIGVSRTVLSEGQRADQQALVRIGAIKARTRILKLSHGVEVSTYRRSEEKTGTGQSASASMALSTFFQVTEERASGKIEQLPVVGSWWSKDRGAFYVAVGMVRKGADKAAGAKRPKNHKADIKGEPPFVDLLRAAPVLRENGGVRIFSINNKKRAIMAVAAARLTASRAQTERIARLKAMRELLAHKKGVQLSSVQYLADGESLRISDKDSEHVMLSDFLSIQEASVSGFISALPVVARWESAEGETLNICIGKLIQ